jgi:ribosomal protein S13
MSEFAFFRFKSNNLLTLEEEAHKQEIISVTEEVLDARGIECDSRIAKISEEQLREILEEVRKLRRKRKRISGDTYDTTNGVEVKEELEEEIPYIK